MLPLFFEEGWKIPDGFQEAWDYDVAKKHIIRQKLPNALGRA